MLTAISAMLLNETVLEVPEQYKMVYEQAISDCHNRNLENVDLRLVKRLIHIENDFFSENSVPEDLRGMLLAAACNESGYNPHARGDWRERDGRRVPMAHGLLQLWPWWESTYNVNRDDYQQSATAWLGHIATLREKNERYSRCPSTFSTIRQWIAAWVQTTRGRATRENNYRCNQVPSHYRVLRRWQDEIQKLKSMQKCTIELEIYGIKILDVPC